MATGKYLFSMNRNMFPAGWEAKAQPSTVKLFGRVPSLGTSLVDIWPQATVRTLPAAAFTLGVVSDNANDVYGTGTGAWMVAKTYLDVNYISHVAVFKLNGQTIVNTPSFLDGVAYTAQITNAWRVNAAEIVQAGNLGFNQGNVYIVDASVTVNGSGVPQSPTKVFAQISNSPSPMNIAEMGGYTVPVGGYQLNGGYWDTGTPSVYHPGILQLQAIQGPQQIGIIDVFAAVTPASTTVFYDRIVMGVAQYAPSANPVTTGAGVLANAQGIIPAAGLQPWKNYLIGGPSSNSGGISPYLPGFLDVVGPMGELRFQAAASAANSEVSIIVEMMQFLATYQGGEM